ncbi:hypothetical protein ACFL16_03530, partial [Patescibacteria group bacterium]
SVCGLEEKFMQAFNVRGLAILEVENSYWANAVLGRILLTVIGMICIEFVVMKIAYHARVDLWDDIIIDGIYVKGKRRMINGMLKGRDASLLGGSSDLTDGESEIVQILPDGTVELAKYDLAFKWRVIPVLVLTRNVVSSVSSDNFFRIMMSNSKEIAFSELRDKLKESYVGRFGIVGEEAASVFVRDLTSQTRSDFDELIGGARKNELLDSTRLIEKLIQKVVNKSLRKLKAEIAKIGTDEVIRMLDDFRENLIRESYARVTLMNTGSGTNGSQVLPPGTRFYAKRGDQEFLVVEQIPQVRNVRIHHSISGRDNSDYFSLAFPYVAFFMVFSEGSLHNLSVYYRNRPLESIDDMLFRANLPNMNRSGVCLGFRGHRVEGLVARAQEVIGHFWSSEFNSDWSGPYEDFRSKEKRVKSFSAWEKNSKKDPTFVLNVNWDPVSSLRSAMAQAISMFQDDNDQCIRREIEAAFTATSSDLSEALKRRFSTIRVENRYPGIISKAAEARYAKLIDASFNGVEKSFRAALQGKSLDREFLTVMDRSVSSALEKDFERLMGEVLIRRRVEHDDLVGKIRREGV